MFSGRLVVLFWHHLFWIPIVSPTQESRLSQLLVAVNSAYAISQTSLGLTHWIFSLMFGGLTKGVVAFEIVGAIGRRYPIFMHVEQLTVDR
jgi:hypothetical protein